MRKVFQCKLQKIGEELLEISYLVTEAIKKASIAFQKNDIKIAKDVIIKDSKIDFLQTDLDERAINILALQGPVASDLRIIVSALRMSASLERMGDLARKLAQLANLRSPNLIIPSKLMNIFKKFVKLDILLAEKINVLLENHEISIAHKIQLVNLQIEKLQDRVLKTIASRDWSESSRTTIDVLLASRYFERFADHAVSVSRKVIYVVTGEWS